MKPFDLDRAIAGDPIETRGGVPVEFVAYATGIQGDFKVIGIMTGSIKTWRMDGTYSLDGRIFEFDLVMKPVIVKKYINLYRVMPHSDNKQCYYLLGPHTFDSESEALVATRGSTNHVKVIEIEEKE